MSQVSCLILYLKSAYVVRTCPYTIDMLPRACFRDSYTKGVHSGGAGEEQNLFSNYLQCF